MVADDYKPGSMDIRDKQAGWEGFTKLITWSSILIAAALVAMRIFLL